MSIEWPIIPPQPDAEQTLLPLALHEHVEMILASESVRAVAERRATQILDYGHRPEDDLSRSIDHLVRHARERLDAFLERSGRGLMVPPAEHRDYLLRKIDIAAALLLAARDRFLVEPPGEDL